MPWKMRRINFSEILFNDFIRLQPTRLFNDSAEFSRIPFRFTKGAHHSPFWSFTTNGAISRNSKWYTHNFSAQCYFSQDCSQVTVEKLSVYQTLLVCRVQIQFATNCSLDVKVTSISINIANYYSFCVLASTVAWFKSSFAKQQCTNGWYHEESLIDLSPRKYIKRFARASPWSRVEFSLELISIINSFRNSRHLKPIFIQLFMPKHH